MDLIYDIQDLYLTESDDSDMKAAVGIVQYKNTWLLGLSAATDDRQGRWCFPGGGIKRGESVEDAAVREVKEETGVRCRAIGDYFTYGGKKGVGFVHCRCSSITHFKPNSEFVALGFFQRKDMKALKLYYNVMNLLDKIR